MPTIAARIRSVVQGLEGEALELAEMVEKVAELRRIADDAEAEEAHHKNRIRVLASAIRMAGTGVS